MNGLVKIIDRQAMSQPEAFEDGANWGRGLPYGRKSYYIRCMEIQAWQSPYFRVRSHPLEERIRTLCAQAITAKEAELGIILNELKAALRQHTERIRHMAAAEILAGKAKSRAPKTPR